MRKTLIALTTVLALSGGVPAALASGRTVIDDCTDDEIMAKTYTQKEYRDALATLPADADQYGNCRDIIARAQDAAVTKGAKKNDGAGATTSGGGTPGAQPPAGPSVQPAKQQLAAASPADRAAVEDARKDAAAPAIAAGAPVDSGRVGTQTSAGTSDLPLPIVVLLALLLAGSLALGAIRIRSLVDTRRA
jgi:hypothetical protein